MVMLNHLAEFLRLPDGTIIEFGGREHEHDPPSGSLFLREFRLENQLPVWKYVIDGIELEKQILFLHGQNTVHISYRLNTPREGLRLELRPSVHFRGHEYAVNEGSVEKYEFGVHRRSI